MEGTTYVQVIQPGKMTPTGGNGGKGGNVYIRVRSHLDALLLPKTVYRAQDGANGKGKCQHGRGGTDLFIDVPLGTLVYELIDHGSVDSSRSAMELKESFDEQMYQHLGKRYNEIKEEESVTADGEEVSKNLLFDSSYSNDNDVFCVAKGGEGGEGNHDWYERSKRQNLRYWGSNRDRRLQATYYKVNLHFHEDVARRTPQQGRKWGNEESSFRNATSGGHRTGRISKRGEVDTAEHAHAIGAENRPLSVYDASPDGGFHEVLERNFAVDCGHSWNHCRSTRQPRSRLVLFASHPANEGVGVCD